MDKSVPLLGEFDFAVLGAALQVGDRLPMRFNGAFELPISPTERAKNSLELLCRYRFILPEKGEYVITPKGVAYCERHKLDVELALRKYCNEAIAQEFLSSIWWPEGSVDAASREIDAEAIISNDEVAPLETFPASDRVVRIGDNSRVKDASAAVQVALHKVSTSNTIDSDSKDLIRSSLGLGLELLKKPKTYLFAISGLLLKPLYDAYASAIEEASKPYIQNAIDAVLMLIR